VSELRKIFLRILLGSLGFAALAGVLAALFASDVTWRITITGLATALAALIMLPLSVMVDRKQSRAAGLCGMAAVVVEFILVMMLVWAVDGLLPGRRPTQSLWMTIGAVAGSSVAAMVFLVAAPRRDTRWAGRVGLALTSAHFVAALIASWVPWQWTMQWWLTAWSIAIFGALAAAALVGAATKDRHHWRWLGVAASAVAACLFIVFAWTRKEDWKTLSVFAAVSAYVAYANLIIRVPLKPGQGWIRVGTMIAGAATAVLTELIVFGSHDELVARADGAASILTCCGTLALTVLARLNRRVDFEPAERELRLITLFCPRCRRKQSLELGGAACRSCGLRIEVRAEEPRCPKCDYLLYKLTSDVCPECGAPIAHDAPVPGGESRE
jgi:MFS family permease